MGNVAIDGNKGKMQPGDAKKSPAIHAYEANFNCYITLIILDGFGLFRAYFSAIANIVCPLARGSHSH